MKIAVLDDYQNAARDWADWARLKDHEITFFHEVYEGLDGFAERLAPFDILCVMRERSPLGRDLLERLPNVKLLATAGEKTIAIDFDLRRANLHRQLDLPREPGITDAFIAKSSVDELIRPTEHPNLSRVMLTSGLVLEVPRPSLNARVRCLPFWCTSVMSAADSR